MVYTDAHIHTAQIHSWIPFLGSPVCTVSHSFDEWKCILEQSSCYPYLVYPCFGIHPQNPDPNLVSVLQSILKKEKHEGIVKLCAIGEAGFDYYTDEYKESSSRQDYVWKEQLILCQEYQKPLIIHCRKALEKIFTYTKELKKIPYVVFHSYSYSFQEALSLRKRGVEAYFSFGKPILNNHKNARKCVSVLPLEWLLLETDAPYQTLKGEKETKNKDIVKVYEEVCKLRGCTLETLEQINKNFKKVFFSHQ